MKLGRSMKLMFPIIISNTSREMSKIYHNVSRLRAMVVDTLDLNKF